MSKPIFVYGLRQSCWDTHGVYEVSSVSDINLNLHWVDRGLYEKDLEAFWADVVEKSEVATKNCGCSLCNLSEAA